MAADTTTPVPIRPVSGATWMGRDVDAMEREDLLNLCYWLFGTMALHREQVKERDEALIKQFSAMRRRPRP